MTSAGNDPRKASITDTKTEQSRRSSNRAAGRCEESPEGRFTEPYNRFLSEYLPVADGETVLDAACGSGRLLRMLSRKARIRAYGIDVSEEVIAAARKTDRNTAYQVALADSLPFPEAFFDFVTVCCAFHHFTKPDRFMEEAFRVLKKGGMLFISDPCPPALIRWAENLVLPRMKRGDVRLYAVKELTGFFQRNGFIGVSPLLKNGMAVISGRKDGHG